MLGTSCATSNADPGEPASPTNPKFVYSFNPRDGMHESLCAGLCFSHSGRYLAVFHGMANDDVLTSGHSSFSVWDMQEKKRLFRNTDGAVVPPIYSSFVKPIWGKDDAWVAVGSSAADFKILDPLTGLVVRSIPIIGHGFCLNKAGDKILFSTVAGELFIYDLEKNLNLTISLNDCNRRINLYPLIYSWEADDLIACAGWAHTNKSSLCKNDIATNQALSDSDAPHDYYVATLNTVDGAIRKVKYFKGQCPWAESMYVNVMSNRASLDQWDILDINTLEVTSIPSSQTGQSVPCDGDFSPDGRYLYVAMANRPGRATSYVIDAANGQQAGTFPGASFHSKVSVSPDGQWLAMCRDGGGVEIYRL